MVNNIMLGGVGGQGLVLTTGIISEAAFRAGFDVKTNDVIGLSQRGGKIWGSVRFGDQVHSPNIPPKSADILLGLEPLEGYRWRGLVREGGVVLLNTARIPPVPVITEKEVYPETIGQTLLETGRFKVKEINALEEARKLGNIKIANTVLIGMLAALLPEIGKDFWSAAIEANVPGKTLDFNLKAFELGYKMI